MKRQRPFSFIEPKLITENNDRITRTDFAAATIRRTASAIFSGVTAPHLITFDRRYRIHKMRKRMIILSILLSCQIALRFFPFSMSRPSAYMSGVSNPAE